MTSIEFRNRYVTNMTISGVDFHDYPDFCEAHFDYAEWLDTGVQLTDNELDDLNDLYPDIVNELANEYMWDSAESSYDMMMDR